MDSKGKKIIKIVLIVLVCVVLVWFSFTLYEFYRVRSDHRPLICFNEVKDTENTEEYSKTCYGLLYKYREYYMISDDSMSAREFTLFFKDFKREVKVYETQQ